MKSTIPVPSKASKSVDGSTSVLESRIIKPALLKAAHPLKIAALAPGSVVVTDGNSVTRGKSIKILSDKLTDMKKTPFLVTVDPEKGELVYEFDKNKELKSVTASKGADLKLGGMRILSDKLVIDPTVGEIRASSEPETSESATLVIPPKVY